MAEKTVEQRCYEALKARGVTFAAAESCTGGLIAKRITDVPGASGVFMGGVVSYTNIVKHRVLGVPADMLEEYGAVSAPVARAMAEGARKATTADCAVSVTGVAGPDRDERGNPVGTVFIGFSSAEETIAERFDFGVKSRAEIREEAADEAFKLLEEKLKEAAVKILLDPACGNVFRIKGFIRKGSGWLQLNATRSVVELRPIGTGQEVLIVIGENLKAEVISDIFGAKPAV